MELKDLFAIINIPLVLALLGILWPAIQRFWRRHAMEALILRELSEIGPYPPDRADQGGWWAHQNKRFVHRAIFEKPEEHLEFLLSLDPNLVYFVTLAWNSLEDNDWIQWRYALRKLSERYDDQLEKFDRQGKIGAPLREWEGLYARYKNQEPPRAS